MNFTRSIEPSFLEMVLEMPVVALLGPRQVGKTTLAKSVQQHIGKESHYLDLESPADLFKLENAEQYLKDRADNVIILDEIQRRPELFPIIRSLVDAQREPGRFIILGSASPDLLRQSSESLAGRISYFELEPLHFQEVARAISMEQHWFRGGFPDILLASNNKMSSRKMDDFIRTYVERDLPALGMSAKPGEIRRLLQMLINVHANLLNVSNLSRSFGMSSPTIQSYLTFLEQAFLIRMLQPYYVNVGKRLVKSPKVYFRDSGMLHSLAGIRDPEDLYGNILVGASWEGYVIQQIIAQLPHDVEAFFYRTQDGAEADLVLVKGGKPFQLVEIKYSSEPRLTKGSYLVQADLGDIPLLVVTSQRDQEQFQLRDNVWVAGVSNMFNLLKLT